MAKIRKLDLGWSDQWSQDQGTLSGNLVHRFVGVAIRGARDGDGWFGGAQLMVAWIRELRLREPEPWDLESVNFYSESQWQPCSQSSGDGNEMSHGRAPGLIDPLPK